MAKTMTNANLDWMEQRVQAEKKKLYNLLEWAEKMESESTLSAADGDRVGSNLRMAIGYLDVALISVVEERRELNKPVDTSAVDEAKAKAKAWAESGSLERARKGQNEAYERVHGRKSPNELLGIGREAIADRDVDLPTFSRRVYEYIVGYLTASGEPEFSDLVAADVAKSLEVSESQIGGALTHLIEKKLVFVEETDVNGGKRLGGDKYSFIYLQH